MHAHESSISCSQALFLSCAHALTCSFPSIRMRSCSHELLLACACVLVLSSYNTLGWHALGAHSFANLFAGARTCLPGGLLATADHAIHAAREYAALPPLLFRRSSAALPLPRYRHFHLGCAHVGPLRDLQGSGGPTYARLVGHQLLLQVSVELKFAKDGEKHSPHTTLVLW